MRDNYGVSKDYPVFSFSFYPIKGVRSSGRDPKLQKTIVLMFNLFFEKNPNSALNYICDNKDGKAELRSKVFQRWFENNQSSTGMVFYKTQFSEEFHSAFVFKKNDRLKGSIDTVLNIQLLLLKQEDKNCCIEVIQN